MDQETRILIIFFHIFRRWKFDILKFKVSLCKTEPVGACESYPGSKLLGIAHSKIPHF